MSAKKPRNPARLILLAIGLVIFVYLIRRVGLRAIDANLLRFLPWLPLTCLIAAGWLFCQALSWWLIQKTYFRRVALGVLYRIKIISDSFNLILPSANLGGDAMRAFMIKESIPLKDGIAGVLFDKTIEFIGSLFFLSGGFILGLVLLRLPTRLTVPVSISLGITAGVILLLVLAQKRGVTGLVMKVSGIFRGGKGWFDKHQSQFLAMDENFRLLYTRSNTRAVRPLALQVLGRVVGVLEVLLIMAVLRSPVTFVQALLICTVVTAGNSLFFVLPGQWGVMEGLHVLVLQSLGYPAAIGLSLAVIRRIRKLIMAGIGLILFALEKRKPTPPEGT